jgi:hypothetical protein
MKSISSLTGPLTVSPHVVRGLLISRSLYWTPDNFYEISGATVGSTHEKGTPHFWARLGVLYISNK